MNSQKTKSVVSLQAASVEVFEKVFGEKINTAELSELRNQRTVSILRSNFSGQFYLTAKGIIAVKSFSGNPSLAYYGPMGVWELTQKNLDNHLKRLNRLKNFLFPLAKA